MSVFTAGPPATIRLRNMAPAIVAALCYSATDILLKVTYASGMDVMTLLSVRSVIAAAFFFVWLRIAPPVRWHGRRETLVAILLGVLFALLMFLLLKAISLLPVSIAILTYFAYPVLTGIGAALSRVEHLGPRALLTALAAFAGLAVMLVQGLGHLSLLGIGCALGASLCRVTSLLATRAFLANTDARVTTWYTLAPATLLFVAASVLTRDWQPQVFAWGWAAFAAVTIVSTAATLLIYTSTNLVGPFRTALALNLEPLVTLIASIVLLGDVLRPTQMVGAAIMLAALCAFQFVRGR